MKQYYICKPGRTQEGPYPEDMVRTCYEQGIFPADSLIWFDGAAEWMPIQSVFAAPRQAPTMPSAPESSVPAPASAAAEIAAVLPQSESSGFSMPMPQSAMPAAPAATVATPPPYMTSPCPVPPPPPQEEAVYYVAQPGMQPQGPYARTAVITGYYQGAYPLGSRVWGPDTGTWIPIENLLGSALHSCNKSVVGHFQGWANAKSWNPITAFISCMKRYAQFSGRASRSEYWFFQLALVILYIPIIIAKAVLAECDAEVVGLLLDLIFRLATLVPIIAVAARRCHDTGRSGWFMLIPIYGWVLFFLPSKNENNPYGSSPLPPA